MKDELEAKLVKAFPNLFSDYDKDKTVTAMYWGCECGDGWYNILYEMCTKLEPLIVGWMKENPTQPECKPRFSQIKEKFGTLNVYMTCATDEMYKITHKAENKSAKTCEQCGEPGKERGLGWIYTACWGCAKEGDRDNFEVIKASYEARMKRLKREKKK